MTSNKTVPIDLRQKASALVEASARWPADTFVIEYDAEWKRAQPALLMAHPLVRRRYSIAIAVLPDGTLVTPYEKKAFETIVKAAFATPTPDDAVDLARLAVAFGDFGAPVGSLLDSIPGSVKPAQPLPRESAEVRFKALPGLSQLRFYTMDYDLGHLYDCDVRLEGRVVKLSAKVLA